MFIRRCSVHKNDFLYKDRIVMKQISQNYKTGEIRIETVNQPLLKTGGVLVETLHSVVSYGTEAMKVKESKLSYLGKARARPDQVKKVMQSVRQQGLMSTYRKVVNKLDTLTPLGYSLSGVVLAVGKGAEEFTVGQRVACGGAGYANHAEINFIPKNLVVPVPDNVHMEHAAFTTIGSIAMQGFRQSEMQLGETACMVGLGLLGQLLVQILVAAGIRVVGVDILQDRCEMAEKSGATIAVTPDAPDLHGAVARLTGGFGIDCIFITAGGNSNGPVELAVDIARDRARVVDIGKTRLDLPWNQYYLKELDVRFSRSYGPGRYDPNYEERGIDYPIGYVRWTERRNMASFLDLVSSGHLNLAPFSSMRIFDEAEQVYQEIAEGKSEGISVVFEYPVDKRKESKLPEYKEIIKQTAEMEGKVRFGVVGAGNYASSMLLPHLSRHPQADLVEVVTATSLSGENAVQKYHFKQSSTNVQALAEAVYIDAVMIATRHATHAPMVSSMLRSGKAVYVEKPLAIDLGGLKNVHESVMESGNKRLMVGFNRRFSPLLRKMKKIYEENREPLVLHYRVHAGQIDVGSWYLDHSEGSRFVGEAGHFFDVFSFVTGARPVSVVARTLRHKEPMQDDRENISVIVEYDDGSVGNLLYLTQGGSKVPKEYLEVFGGNRTVQLHNFEYLRIYEGDRKRDVKAGKLDKGQKNEVHEFVTAVREGADMPITMDSLIDTTITTLATEESLRTGQPVRIAEFWET